MGDMTLEPCPFCGGEAETRNSRWNGRDHWGVICTDCGNPWFDCRGDFEAEAIAAWNTRAPDPRITELEQPCEPGAFAGDIWYGHPEKRNLGTHRWDGSAWQELPSEIEGCLSLLADARARIAALTAEVARKDEALRAALEELWAPEAGCRCHISPPCNDCVEYSSIRSTQDLIRAALEARND